MKKTLALLLALVMVFALASCSGGNGDSSCTTCVDNDGNKICDNCGKEVKGSDNGEPENPPAATNLTVADFVAAMKDMNSTRVDVTIVETSDLGSLTANYKVAFGSGERATISYTREVWDVSEDIFSSDTPAKRTVSGTIEYANGSYSGSMNGAAEAVAKISLNLSTDKLSNVRINGSQLIASVARANSAAVLGVNLPADATLSVTMSSGGKSISVFTLSYADGANNVAFSVAYN